MVPKISGSFLTEILLVLHTKVIMITGKEEKQKNESSPQLELIFCVSPCFSLKQVQPYFGQQSTKRGIYIYIYMIIMSICNIAKEHLWNQYETEGTHMTVNI